MLGDGEELALIDLREELTFSQDHLLWARNVPLSRLELRFARLVPRLTTRIVLCDDNDGLVTRAAEVLTRALHQLRRDTSEVAGRGVRPLSIAATHALSFTFFPKWVRGNERVLALGNLSLISDSMQACEQMMLRGDAQFLLCHHHKDASSRIYSGQFKGIVVGVDTLVPLSAPAGNGVARWRLHGGEPVKYLAYSAQSGLGRIVAAQWGAKDRAFALETVFTSHLAATLLSMARAGDGVAWLPRTLAEEDISAGSLVEAGSSELEIPIEIRLFRPVARQSKAVEAIWSAFERR